MGVCSMSGRQVTGVTASVMIRFISFGVSTSFARHEDLPEARGVWFRTSGDVGRRLEGRVGLAGLYDATADSAIPGDKSVSDRRRKELLV